MLNFDILEDPFFSKKLLRLIGILSSFRLELKSFTVSDYFYVLSYIHKYKEVAGSS